MDRGMQLRVMPAWRFDQRVSIRRIGPARWRYLSRGDRHLIDIGAGERQGYVLPGRPSERRARRGSWLLQQIGSRSSSAVPSRWRRPPTQPTDNRTGRALGDVIPDMTVGTGFPVEATSGFRPLEGRRRLSLVVGPGRWARQAGLGVRWRADWWPRCRPPVPGRQPNPGQVHRPGGVIHPAQEDPQYVLRRNTRSGML